MNVKDLIRFKRQDYRRTFDTEAGQRVLSDLMRRHFVFSVTKVPGDATESAFNEGRRSVILDIMQTVGVDADRVMEHIQQGDPYDRYSDDDGPRTVHQL